MFKYEIEQLEVNNHDFKKQNDYLQECLKNRDQTQDKHKDEMRKLVKENEILQSMKDTLMNLKSVQKKESNTMFKLACSYKQCIDHWVKKANTYDQLIKKHNDADLNDAVLNAFDAEQEYN